MTSMAFYRLRRSLLILHPGVEFRPDTPLERYAGWNARAFLTCLRESSALRLPAPQASWLGGVGCVGVLLAIVFTVIVATTNGAPTAYLAPMALLVVAFIAIRVDPGVLSPECTTLGQLATKASALNYGNIAQGGGAIRPAELWDAMTEVLSDFSSLPTADMHRDTLILQTRS